MIGLVIRQIWRGALIIAVAAGTVSALVAAGHREFIAGTGTGDFAALAGDPAIRIMFGEPVALDDPGGFTVWRTGASLAVLVSAWALLTATRITRGEEEARRWDLLLTGPITLPKLVARHIAVLVTAACVPGMAAYVALSAMGTGQRGAALHGAGIALVGAFFAVVGVFAAQMFPSRAGATGAAVAVLGVGFGLRMAADASVSWLHWSSPFGLLALTRSFASDRPWPLFVLAFTAGVVAVATLAVAGRRDLHNGLSAPRGGRPAQRRLLSSPGAFAVRCMVPSWCGWAVGLGAYYLVMGLLTGSVTGFLADNPRFADLAADAGFTALGSSEGLAATLFSLLAVPAGAFAAVRIATVAAAESQGRFTLTLATPVTRARLLVAETGAALGGVLALLTVVGSAAWAGTLSGDTPIAWASALAGAWNTVPIVLLSLGFAVVALGWAPGAVTGIGLLPGAGGFLLFVVARSVDAPAWITGVSPFGHLAAVPREPVDVGGALGMAAIAAVAAIAGWMGLRRRDLRM